MAMAAASKGVNVARSEEAKKADELLFGEEQCKHLPGYRREYKPVRRRDGTINPHGYEWVVPMGKPSDGGKLTRVASEVGEMLAPHARAAAEAQGRVQARTERVSLRHAGGAQQYMDVARASAFEGVAGWGVPVTHGGGCRIAAGPTGMLFRRSGGWHATGRWCLSRPWSQSGRPAYGRKDGTMKPRGVHEDPDGHVWRWIGRAWRRTT